MKTQTVRIIAGHFRSRKLHFPDVEGLRPTPDRIKETLFNWLRTDILDAVCLDLFAGSGSLGFEAVSRGAKEVVMVDSSRVVIEQLQQTIEMLQIKNVDCSCAVFPSVSFPKKFDIVFLDPPFRKGLVQEALDYLVNRNCLNAHALIYVEMEKSASLMLPSSIQILKEELAGEVKFMLLHQSIEKFSEN